MGVYIEMLARALLDRDFVSAMFANPHDSSYNRYFSATKQIEGLVATSRESLVCSGAWNQVLGNERDDPILQTMYRGC
jgi:hypothetical protein